MHRKPLLDLIATYERRYPEEQTVVTQFRNFITNHADCFERSLQIGHITGAAWIVNPTHDSVLLTHHRKLNIWVQLGGHADGNTDALAVAMQEAHEESGLDHLSPISPEIFDLDVHTIPARKSDPEHLHYDVRFAVQHSGDGQFTVSEESHDLAWVAIADLESVTREESMLRMAQKWLASRKTSSLQNE